MRIKRSLLLRLFICVALIIMSNSLFSCAKKSEEKAKLSRSSIPEDAAPVPVQAPAANESESAESAPAAKRKVILNHTIGLEVKDFSVALEALTKLAESSGGYVFKSTRTGGDKGSISGEVGIRVPTGKAGAVLKSVCGLGRVESENSTAEDITDEYVDMEARLKNAKSSEARLLGLYNKAGKLSDVLAVEKELTRVRGDIEAFEAKKKNWDILTAMVTIEVSLHEPSAGFPSLHSSWSTIREGFGESATTIASSLKVLILFISALLPWLVIIIPIIYLFILWRRKRRRARKGGGVNTEPTRKEEGGG
jgi:hypothetical protein